MPGLQLLPFLSYYGKTNWGVKLPTPPRLGLSCYIRKKALPWTLIGFSYAPVIKHTTTRKA